ncbi:hypothetical protein [Salegentibacter sp.]|uniref:hypothetical protein n=1 Tax=Salegentibacter sp. TaxID=1903072 RepID=UPI00356AB6D5
MRIFEERQSFRQWWLFLILGVVILVISIQLFRKQAIFSEQEKIMLIFFALVPGILVSLLIFSMSLNTRIDSTGIKVKWKPLSFFKKQYSWNEISQVYVRTYAPIREYGGWGLRGFGVNKAWNVSGNSGIQIKTKSGKKFLIGTREPEQAKQVLTRYSNNQKS